MKISYRWIQEFVDCGHLPVAQIAEMLTMAGLEVEGEERYTFSAPATVVVGKILEATPHPDASNLTICTVDAGTGSPLTIVCGAPNARSGIKSPLALPGTILPQGIEIKPSMIRGVTSHGMLCAEDELGLSSDHSVIIELPDDAPLGQPVTGAMVAFDDDTVLEVGLTPNRGDCLSHWGIAREIATLLNRPLRKPSLGYTTNEIDVATLASVVIQDPELCPRYTASVMMGVKLGPSPLWMRRRLEQLGVRAINNVVDVTNYVMLELGQPLHAFDFERLTGQKIVVRRAQQGERFTTLDGTERQLDENMLMIADGERSVAIGGVMGGQNSEVSAVTTKILLESAFFSPPGIRRTSKKLGLSTEASYRFERQIDLSSVAVALKRATKLMAELAGGSVAKGILDVFPRPAKPTRISLRPQRAEKILGMPVPPETIRTILSTLGFVVSPPQDAELPDALTVEVPSYRPDVEREIDLIEEVGRIYGFDKIPVTRPSGEIPDIPRNQAQLLEQKIKTLLVSQGLFEVINYSFFDQKCLERMRVADQVPYHQVVHIKNPLSADQNVMRTTLIPGLLGNVAINCKKTDSIKLFEMGRVFIQANTSARLPKEYLCVSGVLSGVQTPAGWSQSSQHVDFYDLKGMLENLFQTAGIAATFAATDPVPFLHPGEAAQINAGDQILGVAGKIHPDVAEHFQLGSASLYLFELSLPSLLACSSETRRYRTLPKFPSVYRDLAVVVPATVSAAHVEAALLDAGRPLLERIALFDRYVGPQIAHGAVGLTYSLSYRSNEKTLTDAEVSQQHQRIIQHLHTQLGVVLRT